MIALLSLTEATRTCRLYEIKGGVRQQTAIWEWEPDAPPTREQVAQMLTNFKEEKR